MKRTFLAVLVGVLAFSVDANAEEAARRRIAVTVNEHGFEPKKIPVKKDEKVSLVFTRTSEDGCTKEVQIRVSPSELVKKALPVNQPVTIDLAFDKAGEVKFACGMNMYRGVILVE